mgnify:CR=1 FL=1
MSSSTSAPCCRGTSSVSRTQSRRPAASWFRAKPRYVLATCGVVVCPPSTRGLPSWLWVWVCGYVFWQATGSFASEVAATIQEKCFLRLESPIQRVCGYDTPFPLVFEKQYLPDHLKNFEAIKAAVNF